MKQLLALLQWIGGTYNQTFTPGVPIDWIKDFNIEEWKIDRHDPDLSYIIEWKEKKKPKSSGWPCYDARIVAISANINQLTKHMKKLEGELSPHHKIPNLFTNSTQNNTARQSQTSNGKPLRESNDKSKRKLVNEDPSSVPFKKPFEPGQVPSTTRSDSDASKTFNPSISGTSFTENNKKSRKRDHFNISGVDNLDEDCQNRYLRMLYEDNKFIKESLVALAATVTKMNENQANERAAQANESEKMIEIGSKDSGIFVTEDEYNQAKSKGTPTYMGTALIEKLFPAEVLLECNLRGGKSKTLPVDEPRKKLDQKILGEIYKSVKKEFPVSFNKAYLGQCINNKLNKLRYENKKKILKDQDDEEVADN